MEEMINYMTVRVIRKKEYIEELLDQYMGERVLPSILDKQMMELYQMITALSVVDPGMAEVILKYIKLDVLPRLIEADQKGGR